MIEENNSLDWALSGNIFRMLEKHYPGYVWECGVNDHCHIIRLHDAPVKNICYFLNKHDIPATPDSLEKLVVRFGGEFLERCGVNRGAKKFEETILRVEGAKVSDYTSIAAQLNATYNHNDK